MSRAHLALALLALASPALAIELPTNFAEEEVASGLTFPNSMRFLDDGRILVAELKSGQVRLIDGGALGASDPVLTVPDVNTSGGERGLLAIELDPQWPTRPFLYAFYTYRSGATVESRLTRFRASGDLDGSGDRSLSFDAGSPLHLLTQVPDEWNNHNGGDVRFGIDGMLYVSLGDDEGNRCDAQDVTSFLGKILRLQVDQLGLADTGVVAPTALDPGDNPVQDQGDAAKLVHTWGLRNPFRFHVDPTTGNLAVADVGKNEWEEINWVEIAGQNLGWPHREADAVYNIGTGPCPEPQDFSYQSPIDAYSHNLGGALSIVGGPVYRTGPGQKRAWPIQYDGDVFYADFYKGWLVRLDGNGQNWSTASPAPGQPSPQYWATGLQSSPVDFHVGDDGSLYYLSQGQGKILRIVYTGPVTTTDDSFGSFKARFEE